MCNCTTLATEARISEEVLLTMILFLVTLLNYPKKADYKYRYERQIGCTATIVLALQYLIFALWNLIGDYSPKSAAMIVVVAGLITCLSWPYDEKQDDIHMIGARQLTSQIAAVITVLAWVLFTYGILLKK